MNATRRALAAAALLLAPLSLAACQSAVPEDQRTATPLPAPTNAAGATLPAAQGEHNAADAMFVEMMRVHHEQALTLSDLVLAKDGIDPRVRTLAEQIKAAQTPEIDQMRGWLAGWGIAPGSMGDHSAHMDGMVSEADLGRLKAAGAAEGQRLFLEFMIAHHEGAVTMAQDQLRQGTNGQAKELSGAIIGTQKKEIGQMRALLKELLFA